MRVVRLLLLVPLMFGSSVRNLEWNLTSSFAVIDPVVPRR